MMGAVKAETRNGEVSGEIRVIPAKRTASYDVPLDDMAHLSKAKLVAKVNISEITLTLGNGPSRHDGIVRLPKTLKAVDNAIALLEVVRRELETQGVKEVVRRELTRE